MGWQRRASGLSFRKFCFSAKARADQKLFAFETKLKNRGRRDNDRETRRGTALVAKFQNFRDGTDPALNFGDFTDVSNSFVMAYARLMKAGLSHDSIAVAMLGATLNFYEMFGLRAELPDLLRELAEEIESNPLVN